MKALFIFIASLICIRCTLSAMDAQSRPNIILILADDLGYETIGANGGTSYKTPQLNKLASTGVRFTHCYAQPLCTPTRVQLMTGLYNVRNYYKFGVIDSNSVTFANYLMDAGYKTCIAGKWQLGQNIELPRKLGFAEHYLWQHTQRTPRYANPGLEINGASKKFSNGEYGPDIINEYALDFIARNKDRAFFLYYPMILTHAPFQPTPDSPDWDPKAQGEKANVKPNHFAEMVAYMDKLIGEVVTKLELMNLRERTLLLFVGDNGTARGLRSMMGERLVLGGKGATIGAGMHVPLIASWPGTAVPGTVCSNLIDSTDFFPTLLEVAGLKPRQKCDGRSFLPQLLGKTGHPRHWIYSWYSPRQSADLTVREFAFDYRYKLYRSGQFYNLSDDLEEKHALKIELLEGDALAAAKSLQKVLEHFNDARPPELDRAFQQEFKPKEQAAKNATKK